MTTRQPYSLISILTLTVLLVCSCSPDCHDCDNAPADESKSSASTWITYKTGIFNQQHIFYSQFGAAPYDIAANTDVSDTTKPLKPGSDIRFTVYSADKASVVFTAYMEKKPGGTNPADNWSYSATGPSGEKIETGDSCLSCHQQQAHNDYLFSLPVSKAP